MIRVRVNTVQTRDGSRGDGTGGQSKCDVHELGIEPVGGGEVQLHGKLSVTSPTGEKPFEPGKVYELAISEVG